MVFRRLARYNKPLTVVLLLVGGAGLFLLPPVQHLLNQADGVMHLSRWGNWAAVIYTLVFALMTVLGLPGNGLAIAAGAVFGLLWGTLWSVVGATLGAVGAFWLARTLLHSWADRRFGRHSLLVKLNHAVLRHPLQFVLFTRCAPIVPFNLVNFLFGLTPIDLKTYTVGTVIGIIPGTFAYVWLGTAGTQVVHGGDRLPLFGALALLSALSLLPLLLKKRSDP